MLQVFMLVYYLFNTTPHHQSCSLCCVPTKTFLFLQKPVISRVCSLSDNHGRLCFILLPSCQLHTHPHITVLVSLCCNMSSIKLVIYNHEYLQITWNESKLAPIHTFFPLCHSAMAESSNGAAHSFLPEKYPDDSIELIHLRFKTSSWSGIKAGVFLRD